MCPSGKTSELNAPVTVTTQLSSQLPTCSSSPFATGAICSCGVISASIYGQTLENPAQAMHSKKEKLVVRKDVKAVRKTFLALQDHADQWDLDDEHRAMVFAGFGNVFSDLPEARYLHMETGA